MDLDEILRVSLYWKSQQKLLGLSSYVSGKHSPRIHVSLTCLLEGLAWNLRPWSVMYTWYHGVGWGQVSCCKQTAGCGI